MVRVTLEGTPSKSEAGEGGGGGGGEGDGGGGGGGGGGGAAGAVALEARPLRGPRTLLEEEIAGALVAWAAAACTGLFSSLSRRRGRRRRDSGLNRAPRWGEPCGAFDIGARAGCV